MVKERFFAKVKKTDTCWLWTGYINPSGYGTFQLNSNKMAHRVSYEMHKTAIPKGLVLDHLCRVRACVNPDHLEAVTLLENIQRGFGLPMRLSRRTHCECGGTFKIARSTGYRYCPSCIMGRNKKYHEAHREEILSRKRKNYALNRGYERKKARKYFMAHRDEVLRKAKERYAAIRAKAAEEQV